MNDDQLFQGVCDCIRQALRSDLPGIKETDRLVDDLGADSLDFLDIIFRLEKTFNVRVNPRDLERRTQESLGDKAMSIDGCYTKEAVDEFLKSMPEVPAEELYDGMPVSKLPSSFRVKTFMNLVAFMQSPEETLLSHDTLNSRASQAGSELITSSPQDKEGQ